MAYNNKVCILMVTNYYFPTIGGISVYISSLALSLHEDYHIKIISFPNKFRVIENQLNGFVKNIVHFLFVLIFILYSEIIISINKIAHKKIIVHSHSAGFCLIISALSKIIGAKAVHTFHSPINKKSLMLKYFSPLVDALVFVSNTTQEEYQIKSNVSNNLVWIIPGGVDDDLLYPLSEIKQKQLRVKYTTELININCDDKIILFVGRVVEDKGVLPLINSMPLITERIPKAKLIIVGPHDRTHEQKAFYHTLCDVVSKLKMTDHILFTGTLPRKKLIDMYALCDVFTCPSIWNEPVGLVALEAMAMGKTVVATDIGGLPWIVQNDKTGYIVKINDSSSLAEKIIELLKNEELRIIMGTSARESVEKLYSIKVMAAKHKQLYNQL